MASLCECEPFKWTLTRDGISRKPACKNLKFKRAFQFLQLLLIQRVYGIDVTTCSRHRKTLKHSEREQEQLQQSFQVFLGGSCNPTTWRHEQAIPYFQSRSVSYFNPQVAEWTPDLVEIEHRAKELAPLLFFVIDYDTRALASMIEVGYLAARGRSIIVVMTPMPDRQHTKFVQQKNSSHERDDEEDYENVCEVRRTLRTLLRSVNIPVFDHVRIALDYAAFLLETTKRSTTTPSAFNESNNEGDDENDILTPLPTSPDEYSCHGASKVVVIRSLSNQTTFDSPDEFYRQMNQAETGLSSPGPFHERRSSTPDTINHQFSATSVCTKTQVSCSTNESDDDGYGSLGSSNRTLSLSTSSMSSEASEGMSDQQRDDRSSGYNSKKPSESMINHLVSSFYSYVPFVSPSSTPIDTAGTQSLFVLFTLPFRFIKNTLLSPTSSSSSSSTVFKPLQGSNLSDPSFQATSHMFDLYIASGDHDECWLNTFALPTLENENITFTKRQSYHDNDQLDAVYDMHVRQRSRVLYYLINGSERLSHLAAELAFLIGERRHQIIVYLQEKIDDDSEQILCPCERRDLTRSRRYLEDLARKENIELFHSREQSWQRVLSFLHRND